MNDFANLYLYLWRLFLNDSMNILTIAILVGMRTSIAVSSKLKDSLEVSAAACAKERKRSLLERKKKLNRRKRQRFAAGSPGGGSSAAAAADEEEDDGDDEEEEEGSSGDDDLDGDDAEEDADEEEGDSTVSPNGTTTSAAGPSATEMRIKWLDIGDSKASKTKTSLPIVDDVADTLAKCVYAVATGLRPDPYPVRPTLPSPNKTKSELEVVLPKGTRPLGLSLGNFKNHPIVTGFKANADGTKNAAEMSGRVKKGDILVAINGLSIVDMTFKNVIQIIRGIDTPFIHLRLLRWAYYEERTGGWEMVYFSVVCGIGCSCLVLCCQVIVLRVFALCFSVSYLTLTHLKLFLRTPSRWRGHCQSIL